MKRILMGTACVAALLALPAFARADEISDLKSAMAQLQSRLDQLEQAQQQQQQPVTQSNDNAFNPAISVILNGHLGSFSAKDGTLKGFGIGEEGGRSARGFSLDESEIGISSNVDDKLAAQLTASLNKEEGIELEEAYIRTTALPAGLGFKAGRFLEPVGYLNEHHAHSDDFSDRPLPSRAFLNSSYKDDGVLGSWILPTETYAEVGAALVRGDDFPGGGVSGGHPGAWLAYGKLGGDLTENQSWLASVSALQSKPDERLTDDDTVIFSGKSDLYAASLRYVWDPTGNAKEKEVILQGEYFLRREDGTYEDTVAATGAVPFSGNASGWYAQGVYKFLPQWRVGARYSTIYAADAPAGLAGSALDSSGHDPWNASLMGDWSNSEFSRVRLQYTHERPAQGVKDDQILLQYTVAIGAHPAHSF